MHLNGHCIVHAVFFVSRQLHFLLVHFRLRVLMDIRWNSGASWEETRESQSVFCVSLCIRESES